MSPRAKNQYPAGWDEARVKAVADYYDNQTDEEMVAEDEAAMVEGTVVVVPPGMVIEIENFIAKLKAQRGDEQLDG